MKSKRHLYPKEWLQLHPYTDPQPSDAYFVALANRLYAACPPETSLPEHYRQRICWYAAAYLEDIVSELGLWHSFTHQHQQLYGTLLPFYTLSPDYIPEEINPEDVCFLIWNTWQKMEPSHPFLSPSDVRITALCRALYPLLEHAYEEAPENHALDHYFHRFNDEQEALHKLEWLFGRTYLTEPAMAPYLPNVQPADRFIIPTGPLALFLHEWIEELAPAGTAWKEVKGLYPAPPALSSRQTERNRKTYQDFISGTDGYPLVYLDGYDALRRFLVHTLHWPDDEDHTLPHLQSCRNFVLMTHPEKGMLLAKDICEYIADPHNPLYRKEEAVGQAFRLLTEETLCPPDLLTYCLQHRFLPDVRLPQTGEPIVASSSQDFIARHTLLYYYRGD